MDKSQARLVVGLDLNLNTDSDGILDAVEEAVFKEVTFFLKRPFLPALATRCIKRLHQIDLAAEALGIHYDLALIQHSDKENFSAKLDLLSLLSSYHLYESELKAKLANTTKPIQAVSLYNQWINLFESFAQAYLGIFQKLKIESCVVNQDDIRISEVIEFNDLQRELKALKYDNLACKEYYRLQKVMNINKYLA